MKCPICKKVEVNPGDAEFPFCSERCRLLDLGNWASEKYVIPGKPAAGVPLAEEAEDDEQS
ncbi:MAG TPA: DNA gyrase inhibitor YacG [Bryobacteraceae bacterium]|nr:DNA gyrase inhibitor YacG [Bryobacteraceae bacterium]